MSNPLANIPNEQLTHEFWLKSKEQAVLEGEWVIIENQRLPVLAELTKWAAKGTSHTAAEAEARTTPEYQAFLKKAGDKKQELVLARARVKALDLEIRLRLNKSFTDRAEMKSGELNT